MTINAAALAKALRPGVNQWYGHMYNQYPEEWSQIFDVEQSGMYFEEDVSMHGFGLAVAKPEGMPVSYDTMQQGWVKRYQHVEYALGFIITRIAIEDNLYMKKAQVQSQFLAKSMKQAKETVGANILNRATSGSYLGADGKSLLATDHLKSKGGTYSNKLSVAADLSEEALEQAIIEISTWEDDASLKLCAQGMKLIIPPQYEFIAQRILKSELQNDTANNAINVLKSGRYLPGGYTINHYLTDPDMWFIKTDVMNGLKHFVRRPLELTDDNEFDTENMKFKATERYSFGWTDPRGIFGSEGAA